MSHHMGFFDCDRCKYFTKTPTRGLLVCAHPHQTRPGFDFNNCHSVHGKYVVEGHEVKKSRRMLRPLKE